MLVVAVVNKLTRPTLPSSLEVVVGEVISLPMLMFTDVVKFEKKEGETGHAV